MQPAGSEPSEPEPNVSSTVSIILDSQPSCCEFAKSHNLLVVGTYNLITGQDAGSQRTETHVETPVQERTGSLLVFRITKQTATLLQTKVLSYAVLDLHFSPTDPSIFAVATSVGTVSFFSIDYEHDGALMNIRTMTVWDPSVLVLSLAYQTLNGTSKIAVSGSSGSIAVISDKHTEPRVIDPVPAHSQEAWTVAWSRQGLSCDSDLETEPSLYSGGDDSVLLKHDTRVQHSLIRDQKTHTAGVTAIVVLPMLHEGQEVLITGSYDEYIRVLLPPSHGRSKATILAEARLGGGVWRISRPYNDNFAQDEDDTKFNVLASCMHAGAKVVQIRRIVGTWSIEVMAKFTEHESMNYASDVRANEEGHLFASTSFYDRKLCVWSLPC
jgi:diphthamide biosynthesis protein 7